MICTKCNEEKPTNEFYTKANGNLCNPCKKCKSAITKERNREKRKDPLFRKIHSAKVQAYKKTTKGKQSVERYNKSRRKYTDEDREQMRLDRENKEQQRIKERDKRAEDRKKEMVAERERKSSVTYVECRQCKRILSIDNFYRQKHGIPRLDCKECMSDNFKIRDATQERKEWRNNYRKEHGRGESEEQRNAWGAITKAIKSGKLTRPISCPQCGSTKNIQAHHEDYSRPLDVMWFCQLCHKKHHQDKK